MFPLTGTKKKLHTSLGVLEVNKTHVLCQHTGKFGISSKLQEIMCFLAQLCVFEDAEKLLHELSGIEISGKQIQRVSEHYGAQLEVKEEQYQDDEQEPQKVPQEAPVVSAKEDENVYVMTDGSMVFTREEKWKEIKVGRIYAESSRIPIQGERTQVMESIYVCTLGGKNEFLKKFEPYVEPYKHKIFIADGAKWIWNWVDDFYSDSVQILDFFHAAEKLSAYAVLAYNDPIEREKWVKEQKKRLKEDEVEEVLKDLIEIADKTSKTTPAGKALNDLIRYYQNNTARMKYGTFIKKGYLIGSGAIESAHRNVIQQRLKLSGQRWSIEGAQRIANVRAHRKSNRWNELIGLIKNAA